MNRTLKWIVMGVVLVAIGALLIWAFLAGRQELAREREREEPIKVPPRVSRTAEGGIILTLDPETQTRIGLKAETLNATTVQPEIVAYGRLQEDPSQSFTMRSPAAGILRQADSRDWPALGEILADGAQIGVLEPRLTPFERVDASTRLSLAQADVQSIEADLAAAHAALDRARTLNAENKNLSDRALQEAEARVTSQEAKRAAALENARLLQASLTASPGASSSLPLSVSRGGEVVEILTKPNEVVESGQPILRAARFDSLIARVDVPPGEIVPASIATARIVPLGNENISFSGERVGLAANVASATLGQGFLFRFSARGAVLRPGTAVTAYLPVPGTRKQGVSIPRAAVVRYGGKAWAYAQVDAEKFTRREVSVEQPTANGWLVTTGFAPGDRVVVAGAQVMLSEEMKSQIQILEEAEK